MTSIRNPKSEIRASGGRRISPGLAKRLKAVKLLVLDVDGILTDGRMIYGPDGEHMAFHILDGHGIKLALRSGLALAIISGRESSMVARRARELGVEDVQQRVLDKLPAFEALLLRKGLVRSQVACMGDDLQDLPLLLRAGLAISVPGAVDEVRRAAHYVTRRPGGEGAVREAIELLLKVQGHWPAVMERYRR
ncbi:MAG TPA: HAD hydrolase family protein [Candidatus Methylomirabilis sp.]|nr:HAD hydrolase family protein [Candidatus Methylomirabilis sp.]